MSEGRLMIVEDDTDISNMLRIYFQSQEYEVTVAQRGEDALEMCRQQLPHIIVLDIMLPDMDGYDVCRNLRGNLRTSHIPIIFLTQKDERSDKIHGLELGADDYITKPFDLEELKLRVKNAMVRAQYESLTNATTGLPSGRLIEDQLRQLVRRDDWGIAYIGVKKFGEFKDEYGFVARDDVMRAVALMLNHVVEESQDSDAFVGHLDDVSFFVIITPDKVKWVQKELAARLDEAMAFFYPRADWESGKKNESTKLQRLEVTMGILKSSAGPFSNLADLKKASAKVQRKA